MRDFCFVMLWSLSSLTTILVVLGAVDMAREEELLDVHLWMLVNLLAPACGFGVALLLMEA